MASPLFIRYAPGGQQDQTHLAQLHDQGGSAVTEKRKGDTGGRQKVRGDRYVQEHLQEKERGNAWPASIPG